MKLPIIMFLPPPRTRGRHRRRARDEDEDAARDDAGADDGQDHAAQRGEARGVEVVGGLEEPHVEAVERGVEREHHERQVDIGHADQRGRVGEEDLEGALDDAQGEEDGVEEALVPDDLHDGEGADQEVGPEGDRDEEEPHGARVAGGWR
jgi:hypothetical protein